MNLSSNLEQSEKRFKKARERAFERYEKRKRLRAFEMFCFHIIFFSSYT